MTDDSFDSFELSLLDSARDDRMSPAAKNALQATLAATASAAIVATSPLASAATATKAKGFLSLVLTKWVAVGVATSAVVVGGAIATRQLGPAATPSPSSAPLVRVTAPSNPVAPVTPAPLQPETPETPEPASWEAPSEVAPARPSTVVAAPHPAHPERPSVTPARPIAEELRLIEHARSAIAANDFTSAERALASHARAFPTGTFAEEARVLRIDVMAHRGNRARARAAARAYLAAHPASPYEPRLRALLAESPAP